MKFNCGIEPEDERNYVEFNFHPDWFEVIIRHMSYPFWSRLKFAFRMIFKGWDEVEVYITHQQAQQMIDGYQEYIQKSMDDSANKRKAA